MSNLKKTALAVLALSSSAVFAGTMGPVCTPGAVTVPCERTAWDLGIKALYLQNVRSADVGYYGYNTVTTNTTYLQNDPKWGWGFLLEGSYHFSTGNDISVNWTHYDRNQSVFSDRIYFNGSALGAGRVLKTESKWDAVNFEFGQMVNFGEFKKIRFHGGAQYARINNNSYFSPAIIPPNNYNTGRLDSEFSGFGPRTGLDMSYDLGNGFSVFGNSAAAILVGDSKFNGVFSEIVPINPANNIVWSSRGSKRALVPELEAKLGAKYSMDMASGQFTLDGGYMWVNYFNANHVPSEVIFNPATTRMLETDQGYHGPFIGVKYVGNV
jgi:hypothetical protein